MKIGLEIANCFMMWIHKIFYDGCQKIVKVDIPPVFCWC